jgi:hypothetical protein
MGFFIKVVGLAFENESQSDPFIYPLADTEMVFV